MRPDEEIPVNRKNRNSELGARSDTHSHVYENVLVLDALSYQTVLVGILETLRKEPKTLRGECS